MAKYLVQNSRTRRVVSLYGQVLASAVTSSKKTAGALWLTEEQYNSPRVQRLIGLRRLRLVQTEGTPSTSVEESPAAPAPAPEPVAAPEPEPEPVVVPEPEPSGVAVVQADGDIVPIEDADEEGAHVYDESELSALTLPYIRPIAKKLDLDITGMRKADIITAIVDAQGS